MMNLLFGKLVILLNGEAVDYKATSLKNSGKNYNVDGRFKIEVETKIVGEKIIECVLDTDTDVLQGYSESGEELEMISFLIGDYKVSIGTEGDISGYRYECKTNRLSITTNEMLFSNKIIFYVAWVDDYEESKDLYTWFAADPTIDS